MVLLDEIVVNVFPSISNTKQPGVLRWLSSVYWVMKHRYHMAQIGYGNSP